MENKDELYIETMCNVLDVMEFCGFTKEDMVRAFTGIVVIFYGTPEEKFAFYKQYHNK